MNRPMPTWAAGWISMPVAARMKVAIARGASGTPAPCMACARRCASSAWTPGHAARISTGPTPRAAGSRSRAAVTSRVTSLTTRATVPRPNMPDSLRSEERRRDVALAGVRQHGDDPRAARLRPPGDLHRRPHCRAARDAGEDALAPRERAGGLDRRLVGDRDDLVEHLAVEHRRHEARADALDAVRAETPAGEDSRALRLDRDDPQLRIAVL